MENTVANQEHVQETGTKETDWTDTSTVTGGCTDDPIEKNGSVDSDIDQVSQETTDETWHGSNSEDKSRSPETEDVRDKDSPTEANAVHQIHPEADAIAEYDVENVIRKQKTHRLICPHCKKKITRTVLLVKRPRKKIYGGDGVKKPPKSTTHVSETTEIESESDNDDDDDPVPVPDGPESDKKPGDGTRLPSSPASKDDEKEKGEDKKNIDDRKSVPPGVVGVIVANLKTFFRVFPLLYLCIFALWFLSTSPLQFPSISTEQLASTSLMWFLSILAMLFLTIYAMWLRFSFATAMPEGEKVDTKPSSPSKVGVNNDGPETLSGDDEPVVGPEHGSTRKPGKEHERSTPPEDNVPSTLPIAGGVTPGQPPSLEPSPPQESKPDPATEETADPNSRPRDKSNSKEKPIDMWKSNEYGGLIESMRSLGGKIEILKSIVYGGLTESITSLGIVSSAVGSGASTLNILVMGLANLGTGVVLIVNNLLELKAEKPRRRTIDDEDDDEEEDRYEQLIGKRERFRVHVVVVITSFIIFGVIPPLIYSFSFRGTDERRYKAAAVVVVSLACVVSLAIAKAHVTKPRDYLKTVSRYTKLAIGASGISYVIGDLVDDLLEKYGFYAADSAQVRRG